MTSSLTGFSDWHAGRFSLDSEVDNTVSSSNRAASTSHWLIKNTTFFYSLIKGYEQDTSPCLRVELGNFRNISYDQVDEITGDGQIIFSPFVVYMKYGTWGPLIQEALMNGKNVGDIVLIRITSTNGIPMVLQEYTGSDCVITSYRQEGDLIRFTYIARAIQDVCSAKKVDGTDAGNCGFSFNIATTEQKLEDA